MKKYYVYIVECSDGSYYTGVTNDYERRLFEHNSGVDSKAYTFNRRPVKLKFVYDFPDPEQAIEFEKRLKGWSRKKKEAIIEGRWDDLPELSKNYRNRKRIDIKQALS